MKAPLAAALGASAAILACGSARAGGYEVVEQSAVAAATGSAGTGRDDDGSAAWFNPAALADGLGLRLDLGVTLALPTLHAEALASAPDAPWQADTETTVSPPPRLYASYARDDWALAVSANVPFASGVAWPPDWPQRFDVVSSEIQFMRISPCFAYRLGPVRLAAGPQFDIGRVYLKRATNHIEQEGSSAIVMSGNGYGGQAAAFFEVGEHLDLGLSYKSRSVSPLTGDADFSVPTVFAGDYPDQHVSTSWKLPDRLAAGGMFRYGPVAAVLDATVTLWSVNDQLVLDFDSEATAARPSINNWRTSMALRLGAEYRPIEALALRAGFYADGIPAPPPPSERLAPSSPDSTRLAATFGVGGRIGMLSADAFYEHLRLLERDSTSEDAPLARYRGYAHLLGLDLQLHVDGI